MNAEEALALCRLTKACCPQQALDEFTPDAWGEVLGPYSFADSKQAVIELAREQAFISPNDIIRKVRQYRSARLAAFGPFEPPAELEDYRTWFMGMRDAIADGRLTRENYVPPALLGKPRDVPGLLDGAFRSFDEPRVPNEPTETKETP